MALLNLSACPFLSDVFEPFSTAETPNQPRMDWKETPDAHVFIVDLPGLKKKDVKVEIEEGRVLHITGERKDEEKEDKDSRWRCVERGRGRFERRFRLPENAKADKVKAHMDKGVLKVTIPKVEPKKPEVKQIEIAG